MNCIQKRRPSAGHDGRRGWTRVRYVSTFRVTTIPAVDQIMKFHLRPDWSTPSRRDEGSFLSNSFFFSWHQSRGFVCSATTTGSSTQHLLSLDRDPGFTRQGHVSSVHLLAPQHHLPVASLAASVPSTTRRWSPPRKMRPDTHPGTSES